LEKIKDSVLLVEKYLLSILKWGIIATVIGGLGGIIGYLFHHCIEVVTGFRVEKPWLIYCLPIAGLAIAGIYHILQLQEHKGTDGILDSARTPNKVPVRLMPAIFIATVLTHLCGGSAGREGAALQLGGSIAEGVGKTVRLREDEHPILVMCGMSAVFSALFGTPITATLFALEVVSVGSVQYAALLPCLCASAIAYRISLFFGAEPVFFSLSAIPGFELGAVVRLAVLVAACAIVSIGFCMAMHFGHKVMKRALPNPYLRIFTGGVAVILLTLLVGTHDYNGAGMDVVARAIGGEASPTAFLWKILFTMITIGAGFRGGEIVPTFFIGATFGCVMGQLLGMDAGFCAAIGIVAMFCGVVNCPVTSLFLAMELFGGQGMLHFAIACALSYTLSGYYGLYHGQKILYSKLRAEWIDIFTK